MQFVVFLINLFLFLSINSWANAVYDPTSVANNKVGIHILFPSELESAVKIVNNDNKAGWGYVTIPIQAGDRDRVKWQKFFDECRKDKVIPIIRVATVPDGSNWVTPNSYDLIDFANFLGDLQWPTQNRYIIIFNEVNRSDEFGGYVSPEQYADILANASDIFKAKSSDFFILPAGLDNAASNSQKSMNPRQYLERMYLHRPDIFDKIDGWTSHAYPNPGFSSRPNLSGVNKINSFVSDLRLIHQFTIKKLPVFITETGWSNQNLSDYQVGLYYDYAFKNVWNDPNIIAVTPFLLDAKDGPFKQFSFMNDSGQPKEFVSVFSSFATEGSPLIAPVITPMIETSPTATPEALPTSVPEKPSIMSVFRNLFSNFSTVFGLFPKK